MLSLASKPKFYLLNALRFLSMLALLFVLIANFVIMAQDIQALHAPHTVDEEECDYVDASGVPNQATGVFRAFLSIALNIVEIIILFLSETGFPASFFKKWIPCLDGEHSLVALGVLQILLSAQMMSHFLDTYPLVACFFLLIAGLLNIMTMYVDRPKFFRSIDFWRSMRAGNEIKSMESGRSHTYTHSQYAHSAAPSMFTEKQVRSPESQHSELYGFARQDDSALSRNTSRGSGGMRASSPPTYSPPKQPMRVATKGGGRMLL